MRDGRIQSRLTLLVGAMVFSTGCASAGGFGAIESEHERLMELQTELEAFGRQPAGAVMSDDVRIVTYSYSEGDLRLHRDTLSGLENASEWMTKWRAREASGQVVGFPTFDVLECGDGVVQLGAFQLPRTSLSGPVEQEAYQAHWSATPDGWRMDHLWLGPDSDAKASWKGQGCRSRRSLELQLNRVTVAVEGVWLDAPGAQPILEAMRDHGWGALVQGKVGEYYPKFRKAAVLSASASYRITPSIGMQALYTGPRFLRLRGNGEDIAPTLVVKDQSVALMAVVQTGLVRLSAGPALTAVHYDWEPGYTTKYPIMAASETVRGALGRVEIMLPFGRHIRPTVVAQYAWTSDGSVPAYGGLAAQPIPFTGFSVGLGVAGVF